MERYVTESEARADSGQEIILHGPEAFDGMRKAGRLAAETLDMISEYVKPGTTTNELDRLCAEFTIDHGAVSAPLNYKGYPKSICTSLNHVICHGIPDDRQLKDGDILNIDVTVILDGWHGDSSRMYFAGTPNRKAERLTEVTYDALIAGIAAVRPGATVGDIGAAIQAVAESARYSVVRDFCGHGLGRTFHTAPNVMHYGIPASGPELKEGMFFTIEPMINLGRYQAKILADGWTAVTRDRSLSAQFEHSLGVTKDGVEIFTKSPRGLDKPPYDF